MIEIDEEQIQRSLADQGLISAYRQLREGIGQRTIGEEYLCEVLHLPASLSFALETLLAENPQAPDEALDSISWFSLCKGLFLPLSGIAPARVAQLFGFYWRGAPLPKADLVRAFFQRPLGLSLNEKVRCLLGDPFAGRCSYLGQDTLFTVLSSIRLCSTSALRQQLTRVGDIGVLFIAEVQRVKSAPPISAREVLTILAALPHTRANRKKEVLRDLFERAGRLERYFLSRFLLRRLQFGYDYRTELITTAIAELLNLPPEILENAIALSDLFTVVSLLEKEGGAGLRRLVLRPLNPVSPALAGIGEVTRGQFPLWVERKYDGVRLMIHKLTSPGGRSKYAAFTRRKHDWLNLVPALNIALRHLRAHSLILDGELHGYVLDPFSHQFRPATVYEVYQSLIGAVEKPVRLEYTAFDLLYYNGQDLCQRPWKERRQWLEQLLQPLACQNNPVPLTLAEGWEVYTPHDLETWYQYFRQQGYEGLVAKRPQAMYALGKRSDDWLKKKPALFLDLVLTSAFWATGDRGPGPFSAYGIGCRDGSSLREIGQVAALDQEGNAEIVRRILGQGLLTGRQREQRLGVATGQGVELLPTIIVTTRFAGIIREEGGGYSLRDPKVVSLRPAGDASFEEVDRYDLLETLYIKQGLS